VHVYLVRHAIAEDRDPSRWPDDSLRPLTPKGEKRFRLAARGLAHVVPPVDRVLASPYARAWRTAELLHVEAGWPQPEPCLELAADAPAQGALDPLRAHEDPGSVALVGHDPHLPSLAALLLTGAEDGCRIELKKGGVLLLELEPELEPGTALLHWSMAPAILRALGERA
jgi:phosphohistidine phosphatase